MKPEVVCLCGSTRFYDEFQRLNYEFTMEGKIVLSVGFFHHSSKVHGENVGCTEEQKIKLDELHKRKIDLADGIFVINVGGYIGESTKSEIEYAESHNKRIEYMEPIATYKRPPLDEDEHYQEYLEQLSAYQEAVDNGDQ